MDTFCRKSKSERHASREKEWRVVEYDVGAGVQRSLEFCFEEESNDVGDQVIYKTRAGRQIVAMLVASSKMGMTPMDVFNEVLVEDHDILAFLKEYSVTEDVGHSVTTWSRIQAYLLFAKLTKMNVFKPLGKCDVSSCDPSEEEVTGFSTESESIPGHRSEPIKVVVVTLKEEPADIEEINFEHENEYSSFVVNNFSGDESEDETYLDENQRPRLRKRRKDGSAKVSKKMKTPVIRNAPSLNSLVKPVSAVDEAVGLDYTDGNEVTYINTPMIDEDNEMELIQKQYEKAEKKRKKSLEKEAKEASEQRMRLPQIKNMTAKLKTELLEKIATSCGKCGNSEPLLDIPQKDYDVLFREHMMQVHGEKDVTALQSEYDAEMLLKYKNAKTKVVDGKTRYICTKCPEPLLSFEAYRDHAQWHAEIVEREKNFSAKEQTYPCSEENCHSIFTSFLGVWNHMKVVHPRFVFPCRVCDQVSRTQFGRQQHWHKYHYDEGTINVCETCGESFTSQFALYHHTKQHRAKKKKEEDEENGIGNLACEFCGKVYTRKMSLRKHIETVHGEPKYKCPLCPAKFHHRKNIQPHLCREHGAPRKFACELCGQQFIHGTHYKRHMKLHEENPGKVRTPRANRSANGVNRKDQLKKDGQSRQKLPTYEPEPISIATFGNFIEMKIIGAGLCRTGTMSTRKFLDDNGFGPCYHMQECILHGHRSIWESVFESQDYQPVDHLLESYNSGLDLPFIALFEETMEKHPDAKVILGVRDNPQVWVKSWRATVAKICELPFWTNICLMSEKPISDMAQCNMQRFHNYFWKVVIEKGNSISEKKVEVRPTWEMTDEQMEQVYLNWNEYVIRTVPKEKLLIYNIKEGVAPLENFLGLSLPENYTMPFVNDTKQFEQLTIAVKAYSTIQIMGYSLFAASLVTKSRGHLTGALTLIIGSLGVHRIVQKAKLSDPVNPFSFKDLLPKF
ncbi:Oidioi.mRNA.OKI2018_I69.XSR.g16814.t1.cds [Oikopleura dioica]|uniref:Oidioi.mRNA.OKI2018_I69.XSR.g16814.t1.cds n=1 Tax=Oikopleura dioica TaxID=34765 RepID=A0ABN7SM28_OIKDI|nr:Oidioi.mRNA.OKI2018_I69.XSR.g16814.t1.cds [Oikopleura dioica]